MVPAGTITLNANGTYTYIPALNFTGTVPVEYTITDDNTQPATDSATLTIKVVADTPANDPPVAQDDTASTEQGTPVDGNVLVNDSDPDGDPITLTQVKVDTDGDGEADDVIPLSTPTPVYGTDENGNIVPAGTLTVNPDGTWAFTPEPGFTGQVPVEYTIEDPGHLTDDATLTITVVPNAGNQTFANDDANVGSQGETLTGNILTNDFDPEGNDQDVTLIDSDGDGTPIPRRWRAHRSRSSRTAAPSGR
ncbi:MAG: cadherin-like domain-containing protein [Anaerolineae bacterium]|nr:MAG: cadherin-like domain-containing protein [Anaerolineae bacterium]